MTVPSQPLARNYHGTRPCIPVDALLAVCERIAQGRGPSLNDRVVAVLAQLRTKLSR